MADEQRITGRLTGCRFEPKASNAAFDAAILEEVDFSGLAFNSLTAESSHFQDCRFDGIALELGPLAAGRQSTFERCSFANARLIGINPGNARFERCAFDEARIADWTSTCGEFVDCSFSGTISRSTFSGDATGCRDMPLWRRRRTNEYRGNDFRRASLIEVSFIGGIDLDAQLLPDGPEYILLNRLSARVEAAQRKVDALSAEDGLPAEERSAVIGVLKSYQLIAERQDTLFARRADLPLKDPLNERFWELLASVE